MPSEYYDELWETVPEYGGWPPYHKIEWVKGLEPANRALDLGCGDGRLTLELQASELTAADVSLVALNRARGRLTDATLVLLEPDRPLPFDDASFDLVLCADTIEHVRDLRSLLSELKRVLTPLGTLAISTPAHDRYTALELLWGGWEKRFDPLSPPLHHFTTDSLRRVLSLAGMRPRTVATGDGTIFAVVDR
jgi:ubiquinone/menaquinone biosynthesis C-methylase UbiE